jgi:hypothetical protein
VKSVGLVVCCVLACFGSGCRASASAKANVNAGDQPEDVGEGPPAAEPVEKGEAESDLAEGSEQALLGARQDLRLAPNVTTPTCKCLAVALGAPNNAAFAWMGAVPTIDAESQLVIALSSEGVACDGAPKDSLGASYWGYQRQGDDVIVVVESAKFGRPAVGGAVIPRPFGNGQVYVRPATKASVYGRPLDTTQKECRLGSPAPK